MAATIKVDLDVDQAQFLAFFNAFKTFSKGLGDTSTKWEKVGGDMRDAASSGRELVEVSDKLQDNLEKSRISLGSLKTLTEATARGWASISMTTTRVAANIKDATISLLKWSGISGLIGGGVMGVGALGMGALGSSVTANRSAAMGLGTTYGGRQAFNVAFGRFGDAEGFLGRVSGVMSSADKTPLRNLGMSPSEMEGDPATVAARAMQLLGEKGSKIPKGQLNDWLKSNRINEVADVGLTRQAIGATRSGEMGELQNAFAKNRGRFEMSDEAQRGWARFTMHMEIASGILKKVFAGALARLTPSLTKLSQIFTKLIEKLLADGGPVERGLDKLAEWLDTATKDLDEKKIGDWFQNFFDGIKEIVKATGSFLKAMADLLRWFGITPAQASTGGAGGGAGSAGGSGSGTIGGDALARGGGAGGDASSGGEPTPSGLETQSAPGMGAVQKMYPPASHAGAFTPNPSQYPTGKTMGVPAMAGRSGGGAVPQGRIRRSAGKRRSTPRRRQRRA